MAVTVVVSGFNGDFPCLCAVVVEFELEVGPSSTEFEVKLVSE